MCSRTGRVSVTVLEMLRVNAGTPMAEIVALLVMMS